MWFTKNDIMGFGLIVWSWLAVSTPLATAADFNVEPEVIETIQEQKSEKNYKTKKGIASFYHQKFVGRLTANGEVFSNEKYTAASNHFKLGTYVKVTNQKNGKVIYVKINDRMGHPTRVIDLTERAARELGFYQRGLTDVLIEEVAKQEGRNRVLAQNEGQTPRNTDNAEAIQETENVF